MGEFYTDSKGNRLTPIWSLRNGLHFCSFLGPPNDIAPKIVSYRTPVPYLFKESTPTSVLVDLDIRKYASWYNPEEHWVQWIPTAPARDLLSDPSLVCYDVHPVPLKDEYAEDYDSDGREAPDCYVGCTLHPSWADNAFPLLRRLHDMIIVVASSTDWYVANQFSGDLGDIPQLPEHSDGQIYYSEREAQEAASKVKSSILSHIGFLSWFQTLKRLERTPLSREDLELIHSLRLEERPKRGAVYDLSRDAFEANFRFLLDHDVPFHYVWSDKEEVDRRFIFLSPAFWNEYSTLRNALPEGENEVQLELLPSFHTWEHDLGHTDKFFQNGYAGKRGDDIPEFKPTWDFMIIDFHLWGSRRIRNRKMIRPYTERFKGVVAFSVTGDVCTLFRQNPKSGADESPFDRAREDEHKHDLSVFGAADEGEDVDENEVFFESTMVVREQYKNVYAPRPPGRVFNSFNGKQDGHPSTFGATPMVLLEKAPRRGRPPRRHPSPSTESGGYGVEINPSPLKARLGPIASDDMDVPSSSTHLSSDHQGSAFVSPWARGMAGIERQRAARSLSPAPRGHKVERRRSASVQSTRTLDSSDRDSTESFEEEFHSIKADEEMDTAPNSPVAESSILPTEYGAIGEKFEPPSVQQTWAPGFRTRQEAMAKIAEWLSTVIDKEPAQPAYGNLSWNLEWLRDAVLVCDDERTILRLKAMVAVANRVVHIEDLLETALRYGMPFKLFLRVDKAVEDAEEDPESLTEDAIYATGYVDPPMNWVGSENQWLLYRAGLHTVLNRPNAIAFLYMGGIVKFIAETFRPDLAAELAQGPSSQVTQHNKGESRILPNAPDGGMWVADQASAGEVGMLVGTVIGKTAGVELTIWPKQSTLDKASRHWRGYISKGAYAALLNLRKDIMKHHIYQWKSEKEWINYLRKGNTGVHAPNIIPTDEDFDVGRQLLKRSFPLDWQQANVANLILPEKFEPGSNASRD
ncbi:hypothetical protein C8R46DRAFT_1206716 [Mycena filopes]|nr:hypothetical protein C8R46DRAFT_1206716 [Mycena filopes]